MKFFKRKRGVSAKWLNALVASALDGIIAMDEKGRIIAFNPAAEKLFGYRSEQVVGRKVSEKLIPASFQKAHEDGLSRFLATGRWK